MQKKKSSFRYLAAAFLLPASVMLAVYAWYGIYPFGGRSILVIDMNNQYISYFSYLKEALRGGHGFFYSFSKTLCGGMAGLTAYYLMDPWNLLMLFFPVFSLPTAVELITIWDSGNVLPCGIGNLHKFELKNEIWHSLSGGEVGGSPVCGRGLEAWVDGKEVEPMAGLEVFLAVKIPDGTHQVQSRYIPPGLKIGRLLTVISAMLLAV
ncbi:MAG: YfhO family protein [Lachnospiraceae bacterium]|nr:YfhO family protein [Lachnospiraceae bacterium]